MRFMFLLCLLSLSFTSQAMLKSPFHSKNQQLPKRPDFNELKEQLNIGDNKALELKALMERHRAEMDNQREQRQSERDAIRQKHESHRQAVEALLGTDTFTKFESYMQQFRPQRPRHANKK